MVNSSYSRASGQSGFRQRLARRLYRMMGWRLAPFPDLDRAVVVGGPHTSNWDGVVGLTAGVALGLNARFLIKHSLFRGPLGWLLRRFGGIPVDRKQAGGVVGQAVQAFDQVPGLVLAVAPEGTRSNASQFKTGFHHIARRAGVPIVVAVADYGAKSLSFPEVFMPSDDVDADLERILQCFASVTPRHPDKLSGPVRSRWLARNGGDARQ